MRISPVVQSLTEPLLSPLVSAITGVITGVIGGGIRPNPGDYLLTAFGGDYLTDELGNRLTA